MKKNSYRGELMGKEVKQTRNAGFRNLGENQEIDQAREVSLKQ
jgi:hypothetical protein